MEYLPYVIGVVTVILVLPIFIVVLSMCSYLGKVLAIRMLFKKEEKGEE